MRDQIEFRMRGWLEQPEEELNRHREERERERQERLEEAVSREAKREAASVGDEGRDPFRRA